MSDGYTYRCEDAKKWVKTEVKDGIVWLSGEIKKADLPKLMMVLNSLKPKKIENKLTIK